MREYDGDIYFSVYLLKLKLLRRSDSFSVFYSLR